MQKMSEIAADVFPIQQVFKKGKLNPLTDVSVSDFPTSIVLCGKDGRIEHAITTVGSWVFDSNLPQAQPLTSSTLDWCTVVGYDKVYMAVRFKKSSNTKGRKH